MDSGLLDRGLLAILGHRDERTAPYQAPGGNPAGAKQMDSHLVSSTEQDLRGNDGTTSQRDSRFWSGVGGKLCEKDDSATTLAGFRWIIGLAALTLALLLSACAAQEGTEPLQSGETSATAEATPTPQAAPEGKEPTASPAAPTVTDGEEMPAARITDIRFGQHPDFDRLVIDFATDEGDASAVPHWRIEKAPGEGVVRIHLPTVIETAFTDAQLADKLDWFTQVYVVRASDLSLFVDVFIPIEYQIRVQELRDPLRLVIDVAPGGKETHALPVTAKNTVLITPRPGATIQGTVTISGYSRNFEGNNVIILQDSDGNELARAIATSTDYIETWGYFSTELTVPNRTGAGKLLVGDFDAQDGKFQGVTIPVRFGGS